MDVYWLVYRINLWIYYWNVCEIFTNVIIYDKEGGVNGKR